MYNNQKINRVAESNMKRQLLSSIPESDDDYCCDRFDKLFNHIGEVHCHSQPVLLVIIVRFTETTCWTIANDKGTGRW